MLAVSSSHRDPMQTWGGAEKPNGGVSRRASRMAITFPMVLLLHHTIFEAGCQRVSLSARLREMTLEVCARKGDSHASAGTV